jgi:phosphate starvation-inducible PhoH-like protein
VEGPKAKAQRAMDLVQALYELAARPSARPPCSSCCRATARHPHGDEGPSLATRRADLKPRSKNQALYLDNIAEHDITLGIGPAGTGKTYLAVAAAVDALQRSAVQRIILTRPRWRPESAWAFCPVT